MTDAVLRKHLSWVTGYGTFIGVFPGYWDPTLTWFIVKSPTELKPVFLPSVFAINKHKIIPTLYIFIQLAHAGYLLIFLLFGEPSLADVVISFLVLTCISGMAFLAELNYYFNFENICALMNSYHLYERNLGKFIGMFLDQQDFLSF